MGDMDMSIAVTPSDPAPAPVPVPPPVVPNTQSQQDPQPKPPHVYAEDGDKVVSNTESPPVECRFPLQSPLVSFDRTQTTDIRYPTPSGDEC